MAKHQQVGFMGNSEELYHFLRQKRKTFTEMMMKEEKKEVRKKLKAYIDMLEEMEELEFFHKGHIKSMPTLLKALSKDYREYKVVLEEIIAEVEASKKVANAAFEKAGSYLANKYEDSYNSPIQIEARDAIDEFQAVEWEYQQVKREAALRHWLMGIIHEPVEFFKNVTTVKQGGDA